MHQGSILGPCLTRTQMLETHGSCNLGNGSLDFSFLVETKVCFPNPPKSVVYFLQGGPCSNQETDGCGSNSNDQRGKPQVLATMLPLSDRAGAISEFPVS